MKKLYPALQKRLLLFLFLTSLFTVLLTGSLKEKARLTRLTDTTVTSPKFRAHELEPEALKELQKLPRETRGYAVALYLLNKPDKPVPSTFFSAASLHHQEQVWKKRPAWNSYLDSCSAVWNDVIYFPVPVSTYHTKYKIHFVDSWMNERTFGGKRGHEGTDIMANVDSPGLYPVVSMTDGVVKKKGWLPKGGYRLGILSPSGGYFYYAHLDSYAQLSEGDIIHAGDIIGFMGNTGYGPEGTKGMFATHLHVGIYIYPDGVETSINPYWILKTIEEKKLSCSF